ncbi:hypothetical protein Tco_0944332, partial [Tanacetum coccineum]
MYEEYFEKKFSDTPINSAAQPTQIHEDSPSTSSIIVDEHEAPPIVTTSDEQTSPISLTEADEFNQEDSADFDGNSQFVPYNPPSHEEIESSTTALEPSNVQNFHQVQPSTHIWIKDHPLDQVIGDPSKPVMTRQRLHTDSEVCMYALTVSTIEPKNIKEAMTDHSRFECFIAYVAPKNVTSYQMDVKTAFPQWSFEKKKFIQPTWKGLFIQIPPISTNNDLNIGLDYCHNEQHIGNERLDANLQGTPADQTTYRRMIGGLVYLTTSHPDIAFATFGDTKTKSECKSRVDDFRRNEEHEAFSDVARRRSTCLTPPAPVPTVDKVDEMILQDTLQEEEITDEVYELKQREKGKIIEESRSTPFPTPIRSPRIHIDLVSSDTEKLQELTEVQGRYTYLFEHLKARFLSRKSFDTLADHLQEVMVESLPTMVDMHIKEQ